MKAKRIEPVLDDPVLLIHRVSQLAAARLEAAFDAADIQVTPRQYVVMSVLESAAGVSQTRLASITGIDRSTLSEIMRRLVRKRLAERRRSGSDKRAYSTRLTGDGKALCVLARPIVDRENVELVALIPEASRSCFIATLKHLATRAVASSSPSE